LLQEHNLLDSLDDNEDNKKTDEEE
jgi:hypothetical protein